jgi:hypothetical protein
MIDQMCWPRSAAVSRPGRVRSHRRARYRISKLRQSIRLPPGRVQRTGRLTMLYDTGDETDHVRRSMRPCLLLSTRNIKIPARSCATSRLNWGRDRSAPAQRRWVVGWSRPPTIAARIVTSRDHGHLIDGSLSRSRAAVSADRRRRQPWAMNIRRHLYNVFWRVEPTYH